MTEVRRLREARKSQLQREQQLQARGRALEEERAGLEQRLREQQQAQERCQRLREDWEAGSLELLRLKDENYMIAMRLAQLSEEKNSAVLRSRDLQLAVSSGEAGGCCGERAALQNMMVPGSHWVLQSHHLLALGPWASPFSTLGLSFLICNMGMLMALILLRDDCAVSTGSDFPPPGTLAMTGNIFLVVTTKRVPLASSG